MVRAAAVLYHGLDLSFISSIKQTYRKDLDSRKAHILMGSLWCPQLFASLRANARVRCTDNGVSNRYFVATLDQSNHPREIQLFHMLRPTPWNEPSRLAVVAIISKPQLGTHEENLSVCDDDPTVVPVVAVHDRHSNVKEDVVEGRVLQDLGQHFPRVEIEIRLKEMVGA